MRSSVSHLHSCKCPIGAVAAEYAIVICGLVQRPEHEALVTGASCLWVDIHNSCFYMRVYSESVPPPFFILHRWQLRDILVLSHHSSRQGHVCGESVSEFSGAAVRFSSADPKRKSIGNLWRCFGWGMIPGTMLVRRNKNDGFTGGVNLLYWQL